MSLPAGDFSWFFFVNPAFATQDNSLAYYFDSNGTDRLILAQLAASANPRNKVSYYDASWHYIASAATGSQLINYELNSSGATVFRNGASIGTDTYTQVSIGGTTRFFSQSTSETSNNADGDVYEIILIAGRVTPDNRQRIEGYGAHKWGFADQLAVSHPYRYAPPETTEPFLLRHNPRTNKVIPVLSSPTVTDIGATCVRPRVTKGF